MDLILVVFAAAILPFGLVILFGAPFLPTLNKQVYDALDLLDLKPGQTLLELGSGDGKLLRAAASRGINGVGFELNPILVLWSKVRCWKYRDLVTIRWQNAWTARWPKCDGIYVFMMGKFMHKVDKKIRESEHHKGTKVVSYTFQIPNKKPKKTKEALSLYIY